MSAIATSEKDVKPRFVYWGMNSRAQMSILNNTILILILYYIFFYSLHFLFLKSHSQQRFQFKPSPSSPQEPF